MPNFSTLFPTLGFGTNNGDIENWAEVGNSTLIPTSKLESINIGNTFTFESNDDTLAEALTDFYAVATNQYHQGDIAIITYDADGTPGTAQLIYTGTNQTTAGASAAGDWTQLGTGAVTSVTGGNGIHTSSSTGAVTVSNDLKFSHSDGTTYPVDGTYVTRVNFTGSGVTVNPDATNADVVDIAITAGSGAYTVNATPAADVNITLQANTVQVLPAATSTRTFTLPANPPTGTWIKIANLTGRTDTVIARNGQSIQGATTDLILDDSTANFELVYVNSTTGWIVVGAN